MQTRLDPIVTELGQGIKSGEDKGIKEAMWTAMYGLVKGFIKGPEINSASKKMIEELSLDVLVNGGENDDYLRSLASRVFGLYCTHVPISESKQLFR